MCPCHSPPTISARPPGLFPSCPDQTGQWFHICNGCVVGIRQAKIDYCELYAHADPCRKAGHSLRAHQACRGHPCQPFGRAGTRPGNRNSHGCWLSRRLAPQAEPLVVALVHRTGGRLPDLRHQAGLPQLGFHQLRVTAPGRAAWLAVTPEQPQQPAARRQQSAGGRRWRCSPPAGRDRWRRSRCAPRSR